MQHSPPPGQPDLEFAIPRLADHSADLRMLLLSVMALVVGSGSAMGAWALLKLISLATNIAWFHRISVAPVRIADAATGLAIMLVPIGGALIIGLMARFGSDKIRGHGIPEAIEAILFGQSRLSLKVALLKPLSSAVSIGSGGPFGAEGPIIMTGGAIGSLFAQCFHMSAAERKTLLAAGAAAGMTAIFGTPIAAILLALEVLLFEWKPRSLVPVIAGALTAIAWRPLLIGVGPLFPFAGHVPLDWWALPAAGALGILTGLEAASLSAILYRIEDAFHQLPIHWMWWPAIGAIVVGLGGLIEPRVLGAGYDTIQALLDGSLTIRVTMLLLATKAVVWLIALGSGTSGGVLAPLLILGGALGCIAGHVLPGDPGFWVLIGMAGILSSGMRAPLTGAVFAVELTGRLDCLPLTAAAAAAGYAVAVLILRRSILTEKIARRGRHLSQEYGVDPMAMVKIGDIMTADPDTLPATMLRREAMRFFADGAHHRTYPVVDGTNRPIAMASRSDALRWQATPSPEDVPIGDLLSDLSIPLLHAEMPAFVAADLMIAEDIGRLPVVDPVTHAIVGIVARRDLLRVRAGQHRDEKSRERFGRNGTAASA